jgi:hypothetical protein
MYSKTIRIATLSAALLAASCGSVLPWSKQPVADEVNLAFTLQNNLVILQSVTVDGRPGRFLFGSATPQTLLDPAVRPVGGAHVAQLSTRDAIPFTPAAASLRGIADGIIGVDIFGKRGVSIDYHAGLVTYQKSGIHRELMTMYRFTAAPAIQVLVDGRAIPAIVDSTSPDTLTLPGSGARRGTARVAIAGTDFGATDVGYANVSEAHVGNRLLSKFLVSIDYGAKQVGLFRDPRVPSR